MEVKNVAESYNKIADEYVQRHGYVGLSVPTLNRFVALLPKGAKVLDVGCGGGQDAKFLDEHGCEVLGIDVSTKMIALAEAHAPKVNFEVADLMTLPDLAESDAIWCYRVFHHVPLTEQDAFLEKLSRLLKNGGILCLTSNVSETGADYEAFDSGNDSLLKKRLTAESFRELLIRHGFEPIHFSFWTGGQGMEIFGRKT
jgi:2-polyprenyl-3-methyl-5-hydroxy-6-metoxy-1,4-benzoquinol methylase